MAKISEEACMWDMSRIHMKNTRSEAHVRCSLGRPRLWLQEISSWKGLMVWECQITNIKGLQVVLIGVLFKQNTRRDA